MTLPKSFGVARGWPCAPGRPVAVATAPSLPAAPAMTLTRGSGQVSVAWIDGANGGAPITAHTLYRGTSAGAEALVGTVATSSPYLDTGLTNGTAYFYRLGAVNAVGEGPLCAEVSATPIAAPTLAPLGNRNDAPTGTSGTTASPYNYTGNYIVHRWNTSGAAMANPVLLLPAFYVDGTSTEIANVTPFEVRVGIEYPLGNTSRYQVTAGGLAAMPVDNTSWGTKSDPVAGLTIPAGAEFKLHVYCRSPGGNAQGYIAGTTLTVTGGMTGAGQQTIPVGTVISGALSGSTPYGQVTAVLGGGQYTLSASNTAFSAGTPGTIYFGSWFPVAYRQPQTSLGDFAVAAATQADQSMSGGPTTAAVTSVYNPIVLGTPASAVSSYLIIGDSIAAGLGEQSYGTIAGSEPASCDVYGNIGPFERWLGLPSGGWGYVNLARPSSQAAQWATAGRTTLRQALASQFGYTRILNALGRNDYANGQTPSQIVASNNAVNALFRTGAQAVVISTLAPTATATRALSGVTMSGAVATATPASGDFSDVPAGANVVQAGTAPAGYNTANGWVTTAAGASTLSYTTNQSGLAASTTPGTVSTWTRLADQAIPNATNEANRTGYNGTVRASGLANQTGVFELADTLESARNAGLWAAPAGVQPTRDGIHPTATRNAAAAAANGAAA